MQIQLDLHLYAITRSWLGDTVEYAVFPSADMAKHCNSESDQYYYLKPVTIVEDVPELDVTQLKVQGYEKLLDKVRADYYAKVTEIRGQINNLLALPMNETKSEEDDIPF